MIRRVKNDVQSGVICRVMDDKGYPVAANMKRERLKEKGLMRSKELMQRVRRNNTGFTLLEILIVLALLLVLGSVAVVGFTQIRDKANRDAAKVKVDQTVNAINLYAATMNEYPDNETGLRALIEPPEDEELAKKWAGPYFEDRQIPRDPWGQELQYERIESTMDDRGVAQKPFRVWSYGPDKQDGTDDDIRSWSEENQ